MRDFNGSTQYATLSGLSVGGADFSIACTVICDTNGIGRGVLSSAGATTWFLHIGGGIQALNFFTAEATSTGSFPTGTVVRVVGTYTHSTTTCRIYINGTLEGTNSSAAITSASGIDIGRRGDGIYWDGGISAIGIWSSVLDAADARSLAAGDAPERVKPASLLAQLHMLRGDGSRDSWGSYTVTESNSPGSRSSHPREIFTGRPVVASVYSGGSPPASTSNNLLLMGVG